MIGTYDPAHPLIQRPGAVLAWVTPDQSDDRYAVVYDNPDCAGDHVGYFQDGLDVAMSVADEIEEQTRGECGHDGGSCPTTIYSLVPVGVPT